MSQRGECLECGVTLKDMVESTVIAFRMGVDDLEEHLRQKRLRWFGHIARRGEEVEIKKVFEFANLGVMLNDTGGV